MKILVDFEALTGSDARPVLGPMLWRARQAFKGALNLGDASDDEKNQLWVFFMERLRHLMQARDLEYEEIQAITGRAKAIDSVSPSDLIDRARHLARGRKMPAFASVAEAYKRANNIVESAWGSVETHDRWRLQAGHLKEPAEIQLQTATERMGAEVTQALGSREPARALAAIASIQPHLARFFDEVRVMVDDPSVQEARLALLAEVRDRISEFGDISGLAPKAGQV